MSDWCKLDFNDDDRVLSRKGHLSRPGRPVTYGTEKDYLIAAWVLEQREQQLLVTVDNICNQARVIVGKEDFLTSRNWAEAFMKRQDLVLCAKTSVAQKLPAELKAKISAFHEFVKQRRDKDDFDDMYIINMDKTLMFFDLLLGKTVDFKGTKSIHIRTTISEKRHLTVVLAVSAAGDVLPPMIIFKGKRALNIQTPPGWIVCVQEKAWMDKERMLRWIKDIYLRHTEKERSLLVMDPFHAHLTDNVKKCLRKGNTVPAIIPGVCTSKIQPLDVSINKLFKADLQRSWATYIRSTAEKVQQMEILYKD